jgi:PAS domain S-box-containing protein
MLESEDRWLAAHEASGMGVWDWDVSANHIYYSKIWKAMRGIAEHEDGPAVAEWDDWLHPDDRDRCGAALQAHIDGITPLYELEQRVRCTDGSYRWVLARGMVYERDADGTPLRIIGTNLDIDDAKKASIRGQRHARLQDAIAACNAAIGQRQSVGELSNAICRILVERGEMKLAWVGRPSRDGTCIEPAAIFSQNPDAYHLRDVEISTSAEEPSGRGPTGIAFRGPDAVWVENTATDPRTAIWHGRAAKSGLQGAAAIPIRQRSGTTGVLTLHTDEPAFFDETTRSLLLDMVWQFGLALDALDAEKAAEEFQESARQSEWRARAIFERAPLGIALVDSVTGHFLDANAKFQEIVGRDHTTLLGLRWQDITLEEDLPECLEVAAPFLAGEISGFQSEKRYARPDGKAVPVSLTATQFDSPAGENPRHMVMIEDVTERIELQHQLSQRQRLEALGQLTGGIAHDFNNLLTVIIGNSEALAQELGEGDLGELAGLILTTGERAADLTGRLLTFASKQSLIPRSVKIGDLVDGLLPLLRRAVPDSIELNLSARFSSRSVYADPAQLEMVLLNLVLNARDALPGGGRIDISSENVVVGRNSQQYTELQPGRYVMLCLSDDGVGMSEDTVEKAFDPFFTTKGPGQGSGLGLSMVYGFARQSGGHVELASRLGDGTMVRLYLPAATRSSPEVEAAGEAPDNRGAGETVLIAEDDAMVRKYVTSQVGSLGYQTIAMPDGKSALEFLRGDTEVDLLFTDIAMEGGMDGIELAILARTMKPDLPVLFTSGHAEQHQERLSAIEAMLLRKPYRKKELADNLRKALSVPLSQYKL